MPLSVCVRSRFLVFRGNYKIQPVSKQWAWYIFVYTDYELVRSYAEINWSWCTDLCHFRVKCCASMNTIYLTALRGRVCFDVCLDFEYLIIPSTASGIFRHIKYQNNSTSSSNSIRQRLNLHAEFSGLSTVAYIHPRKFRASIPRVKCW